MILHVLDHSLPEQSGYATRSHSILEALKSSGTNCIAVTGPKHNSASVAEETVAGIRYLRTCPIPGRNYQSGPGQLRSILETRSRIKELAKTYVPRLIHAHSPCLNGIAALGHGVPLIYEMRSSWEDAAVSSGTTSAGSLRYRASRALEELVFARCTAITVICDGLRTDLVRRGVDPHKITIVPNAVPEELLDDGAMGDCKDQLGLGGSKIIGYFGSFFDWEGIDELISAMPGVLEREPQAKLLLAGSGEKQADLRAFARQTGVMEKVIFAGRVPVEEMKTYYGAADVMVFPRKPHRLTETVTPLKPLEAMARRVPVVASDVAGHRELITHNETGFLYRCGSRDQLVASISRVLADSQASQGLVDAAYRWVVQERRWGSVCKKYQDLYEAVSPQ